MKRFLTGALVMLLLPLTGSVTAGTFTKFNTLIPVPARATATANGNTSSASTNTIHLDAAVYLPVGVAAPAPVIVIVHGYGGSKKDERVITLATDFATAGYVVVTPTVRGFGDSDGNVSLVGPDEINDLKTLLLALPSGIIGDDPPIEIPVTGASKIGLLGPSYGGGHVFEALRLHVPGLAAAVAIIGWTDLYQALCPNDVPKLTYSLGLFAGGFDFLHPNYSNQMYDWQRALLAGHPEQTRTGDPADNIDWRSAIFTPAALDIPLFVIQGWRDYLFPAEQALNLWQSAHASPFLKLYLGGLGHPPAALDITGPEGIYLRAQTLRWFEQWLKDTDTGILNEPRLTIAPEKTTDWSSNLLMHAESWPLPGAVTQTFYCNRSTLTNAPGTNGPAKLSPSYGGLYFLTPLLDNLDADNCQLITSIIAVNAILNSGASDILDPKTFTKTDSGAHAVKFISNALPADLVVLGVPRFHLTVSALRSNACYFVQLQERLPNGTTKLVTRGAYKDHATDPQLPHSIELSPFAIHHRFTVGTRIVVTITSRDYPFFLPNLEQPKVKIYRDATRPSWMEFPVAP